MLLSQKVEKYFFYSILSIISVFLFYVCYTAKITYDPGDGIQHYLMARYSWEHPALLLNHWGKPIFTLFSSPFAQFGLYGVNIFQILCSMCVSYFCFRIASKLELRIAWILPMFICFSPIYFAVINSGLTEIFFSCILMAAIWLIFEQKYIPAAIVASLLPFVRVEAFVVFPLIFLILLIRKQFIALPFLSSGFIIYSFIGFFYYDDLLWVINQSQDFFNEGYKNGKGDFFHYVFHYKEILGTALSILFVVGLIWAAYTIVFSAYNKNKSPFFLEEIFLIYGSLFACLLLNTLSYWLPGVLTNLGIINYMATLIPAAALISLRGLNLCIAPIKKYFVVPIVFLLLISFFVIRCPFTQWYYPFHAGNEEPVVAATGRWLNNTLPSNHRIYYNHPYLPMVLDLDPFDDTKTTLLSSFDKENLYSLPDSTIIIWDSHYSPQEGALPFEFLMKDTDLVPMKHFKYFRDAAPFETWIFMKSSFSGLVNHSLPSEIITDFEVSEAGFELSKIGSDFFDFDLNLPENKYLLTKEKFFSGQTSLKYNKEDEYGPVFSKKMSSIKNFTSLQSIQINFEFFPCDSLKDIIPVIEIKDGDKNVGWEGLNFKQSININTWNLCEIKITFPPQKIKKTHTIVFYFWNKGKRSFFVDDIHLQYFGLK